MYTVPKHCSIFYYGILRYFWEGDGRLCGRGAASGTWRGEGRLGMEGMEWKNRIRQRSSAIRCCRSNIISFFPTCTFLAAIIPSVHVICQPRRRTCALSAATAINRVSLPSCSSLKIADRSLRMHHVLCGVEWFISSDHPNQSPPSPLSDVALSPSVIFTQPLAVVFPSYRSHHITPLLPCLVQQTMQLFPQSSQFLVYILYRWLLTAKSLTLPHLLIISCCFVVMYRYDW